VGGEWEESRFDREVRTTSSLVSWSTLGGERQVANPGYKEIFGFTWNGM
jgi:hypothetical protein